MWVCSLGEGTLSVVLLAPLGRGLVPCSVSCHCDRPRYEIALRLSPGNTCAATHVAYGKRRLRAEAEAEAAGGKEVEGQEEGARSDGGAEGEVETDGWEADAISSEGIELADLSVDVRCPATLLPCCPSRNNIGR